MADNNNDEYQFADLDAINSENTSDQVNTNPSDPEFTTTDDSLLQRIQDNPVLRNALIVIGGIIALIILYKIIMSFFGTHTPPVNPPALKPIPAMIQPSPMPVSTQPTETQIKMNQQLSSLEAAQDTMRADMTSVSSQLGGIQDNLNTMIQKMNDLNTLVTNLNSKVEEQSQELDRLRTRQVKHHRVNRSGAGIHYPTYYIKAVIPGRAWLIGSNGRTLTVRDGTTIAGYGTVRLIDPNQGRVVTSSGRVIRFSQEDS